MDINTKSSISTLDLFLKRLFDVFLSSIGLVVTWWLIILAWIVATVETRSNGFFTQQRVGRGGRLFNVIKIKTMSQRAEVGTTITTKNDSRVTRSGMFFRKTKIDELPQLLNVLAGQMSFVGPRPDVPGYADRLKGCDKVILSVRPGITGPATIKYRDEEALLAEQDNPVDYNDRVIFPDKVKINKDYVLNYSFTKDIKYIWITIFGSSFLC